MFSRIALLLLAVTLTTQAIAAQHTPPRHDMCREATPTIRQMWLSGAYDAPPAVAALMVDAIDGKLSGVRQQLQDMPPADTWRWRQTAMLTAVWTGQTAVVDGLLDDGAAVNSTGWVPPLKPGFFGQTVDAMKHDPRFGGATALKGLMAAGVVGNQGELTGPALMAATQCGDVATLDVLLRHHVNIAQRRTPNAPDALTVATVDGDAVVVQFLLDHGADPCADDRRTNSFHHKHATRAAHTLAQMGAHSMLPAKLVARLTCPVVASIR